MPKRPTLDQRVKWHVAHAAACACRELPENMRRELKSRGIKLPKRKSTRKR
jgi:hypothetical protein